MPRTGRNSGLRAAGVRAERAGRRMTPAAPGRTHPRQDMSGLDEGEPGVVEAEREALKYVRSLPPPMMAVGDSRMRAARRFHRRQRRNIDA